MSDQSEQGTHFWQMSFMFRNRLPEERTGHWTPPAGYTRFDAFNELRRQIVELYPELSSGAVVSFHLESNAL